MNNIKAIAFDLDGTIYIGDRLVPGVEDLIDFLRSKRLKVIFFTNNSTKSKKDIYKKLIDLGIDLSINDVYTSSYSTAIFLRENLLDDVYCVGTSGLRDELKKQQINIVTDEEKAKNIVVGLDEDFNEEKLKKVETVSLNRNCKVIACNKDKGFPVEHGKKMLGCGSIVEIVEKRIGRPVDYVVGKPSLFMLQLLMKDLHLKSNEILVVGDSYSSDIQMAVKAGCLSVLITDTILPYNDTIIVDNIVKIKSLFELQTGFSKLLQIRTYESLRSEILEPYAGVLENLKKVYIFGAQRLGEKIYKQCTQSGIEVLAFIDNDTNKQGKYFLEKSILSLSEVKDKNSIIIIASTTYLGDILKQLKKLTYKNYIPYPILSIYNGDNFLPEYTFYNMQQDLVDNKFKYISLLLSVVDDKSRETLDKLINFRLSLDPSCLDYSSANHYFEQEIYKIGNDEVFIDGGGYTGDSTQDFIERVNGEYQKIFVFEPDNNLFKEATENLKGQQNIYFIQKGLYSKDGSVTFNATGELDGSITDEGNHLIEVTSIDSAIQDKITFIKLDIEGAEADALMGAKNHLIRDSPKLAIACYHKSEDLWHLPQTISKINNNYRFFFRHYSQTSLETVLYCVSKDDVNL